jgi:hypothetical protein
MRTPHRSTDNFARYGDDIYSEGNRSLSGSKARHSVFQNLGVVDPMQGISTWIFFYHTEVSQSHDEELCDGYMKGMPCLKMGSLNVESPSSFGCSSKSERRSGRHYDVLKTESEFEYQGKENRTFHGVSNFNHMNVCFEKNNCGWLKERRGNFTPHF